jgi:chromate transport protein ChrA
LSLHRLLGNIRGGIVFARENVKELRRTSWCCFGVCAICLLSTAYYMPFLLISVAAGFVGLIVRIVKNTFEQAIAMKEELDFTV